MHGLFVKKNKLHDDRHGTDAIILAHAHRSAFKNTSTRLDSNNNQS